MSIEINIMVDEKFTAALNNIAESIRATRLPVVTETVTEVQEENAPKKTVKFRKTEKAAEPVKAEPAAPAPAPVEEKKPEPEPAAAPAPAPVEEKKPEPAPKAPDRQYSLSELTTAGAKAMAKGLPAIKALNDLGARTIMELPKEKYGEFAKALIEMGAEI